MASTSVPSNGPVRLGEVEGYDGRINEIIYYPPRSGSITGCVIYFGGDMQDYKEQMLAHRDNQHYAEWDLETTAELLHCRFPTQAVLVVRPSKMSLMTFSCYKNFVTVNNFGAPTYDNNVDSLNHLKLLLQNTESTIQKNCKSESENLANFPTYIRNPITLIGFSKGCVVLNQFLYSIYSLHENPNQELGAFIGNIAIIYWLEGGHSGTSSIWVTDREVLKQFSDLKVAVHIHVTPYQVLCDTRPRIGKEEKIFRDILLKLKMIVTRKLHF